MTAGCIEPAVREAGGTCVLQQCISVIRDERCRQYLINEPDEVSWHILRDGGFLAGPIFPTNLWTDTIEKPIRRVVSVCMLERNAIGCNIELRVELEV